MSYFEDYIEDGMCCESCGAFIGGDEPGFIQRCDACRDDLDDGDDDDLEASLGGR